MPHQAAASRRHTLTAVLAVVLASAAGCTTTQPTPAAPAADRVPDRKPDLTSNLQVEAGQTFVYAGDGAGAYRIAASNVSDIAVSAFIRSGGVDTYVRDLPPGAAATLSFSPGQAALFRNPGPAQARLKLLVWGDTNVGMRYEPNTPGR